MFLIYPVRNIAICALLLALISCSDNNNPPAATNTDTVVSKTEEEKVFDYPVQFKNWKIGEHSNTRLAVQMYKAWDQGSIKDMESLLADTMTMELPDGRRFSGAKDKMLTDLIKSRKKYKSSSNDILAAYPLVNTDNNDHWVNVLVYNKWRYTDGMRDSMLYQDLWKIRDGKIRQLVSLEQMPSRTGTKRLEELTREK
jgi:ketosteroid isomerase-like protein